MKKGIGAIIGLFLGKQLDFRVRLFNVLAVTGMLVGLIMGSINAANGGGTLSAVTGIGSAVLSFALLVFATKTGRYKISYLLTILVIFIGYFPTLFFRMGGYHGGKVAFFIFAVVFTAFMLEGATAWIVIAIEMAVYSGVCVYAYIHPESVNFFSAEKGYLTDTLSGFIFASLALSVTLVQHLRMYNQQRLDLEVAREEAITSANAKSAFLANMSHEIRTPINVMLGMTEMVLRESRGGSVAEYARKIQNAGNMLLVLVSNILDVSKIESGKVTMAEDRYRVAALMSELYEIGAESARKRDLAFSIKADAGLPSELWGDSARIKQIIANFLSNAAKYTESGDITLKFGFRDSLREDETVLKISVEDTGIGVKEESLPLLFDAFTRVDTPSSQSIEGTGLGLAIAKDLAEMMNGQIFVKSEYGKGSEFWVEIPQKVVSAKPLEDWRSEERNPSGLEETFTAPKARILIVDDNQENLLTLKALLKRTLARVDLAQSGAQCLEAAKKEDYDIILMDLMMPGMNGSETFQKLRKELGFSAPVIALTANAVSGTNEKLLEEGFSECILKPVQSSKLEEALASRLPQELVTRRTAGKEDWASPKLKEELSKGLASAGVSLGDGLFNSGGDLSLLASMAEVFSSNHPDSKAQMENALESLDLERLRHYTHSLKSSAGFVGASDLARIAERSERGCKDKDEKAIKLALPFLLNEWDKASAALKSFAEKTRAAEPPADSPARGFDPTKLARQIDNMVRRGAVAEIDLLIAEKGENPKLEEAKRSIEKLDFDTAKQILDSLGIWKGDAK
ncbi:MAG: response regulator [Clostridiales bacterium]|nr:response regulator [Clostridiales bacterium]